MLDLPYALAGQADVLADFFQRHRILAIEAIAQLEDFGRTGIDFIQQLFQLTEIIVAADPFIGPGIVRVDDDIFDGDFAIA